MGRAPPAASDKETPAMDDATSLTRQRYDRVARFYDYFEVGMELFARSWRAQLWSWITEGRVLEVGVGTGKNIPFYPKGIDITGIDLSPRMLERAQKRAARLGMTPELIVADVQALPFPDCSFDTAVTSCVFCSVPDPVLGLLEIRRVLKPGGRLLMLEHVLSHRPVARCLMNLLDPIPSHLWGAHINRNTVQNVELVGFTEVADDNLFLDIVKFIRARAPS